MCVCVWRIDCGVCGGRRGARKVEVEVRGRGGEAVVSDGVCVL